MRRQSLRTLSKFRCSRARHTRDRHRVFFGRNVRISGRRYSIVLDCGRALYFSSGRLAVWIWCDLSLFFGRFTAATRFTTMRCRRLLGEFFNFTARLFSSIGGESPSIGGEFSSIGGEFSSMTGEARVRHR
ncbi:unnamed protein product [Trichogramma brassicae]|uniref:Uncharacterized protein n=1 Tax=Trichogramma brassicae TaxID=86971 RepID=A0A6H5J802_9HYME|nr:unnamed protein product [Trichogramma brassicae]